MTSVPLVFSVILPELDKLPLNVVVFVFDIVNIPLVNVPAPLNVIALLPPMLELAVILNGLAIEKLPLLANVPPFNTIFPMPNGPFVILPEPVLLTPMVNVPALRNVLLTPDAPYVLAPDNMVLPVPIFVSVLLVDVPLIIPLNVPLPAPPILLELCKLIALVITSLAPERVNAPVLEMPVPFKLIAVFAANVPAAKLKSNTPPEETVVLDVLFVPLPKPLAFCTLNVPDETVVVPTYWLTPDKINVPLLF